MRCISCGAEIEDGSSFCGVCGAPVVSGNTNVNTGERCKYCGAPMDPGSGYCSVCGSYNGGSINDTGNIGPAQKSVNMNVVVSIIAAIVVIAAAVIGFILVRNSGNDNSDNGASTVVSQQTQSPIQTVAPPAVMSTVPPVQNYSASNYTAAQSQAGYYVFPSDRVYITQADLDARTRDEIRLILNEMYARHGYIFTTQQYRDYFSAQPWYRGTSTDQNAVASYFNAYETANKNFIIAYEQAHGWR